ncbi:MAG: hypothetical protein ACRDTU_09820 [Micromonosporaceae bacterium]
MRLRPGIQFRPTISQWAWGLVGLALLVVICLAAYRNLADIFNSQKDFVVGSLFSLTGFCFAKALTRTRGQRALEALRDEGVFEHISLVDRNVRAATERLSEYHDLECRGLEFYRNAGLLRVVLDDLDKSAANLVDLRRALGVEVVPENHISSDIRLHLVSIRRNLREGLVRRDQAYEWFQTRLDRSDRESWDLFAVMTSDIQKASLSMDALLSQYVAYPPAEYVRTIRGYLRAASQREQEFRSAVDSVPRIFDVMSQDIQQAVEDLETVEQRLHTGELSAREAVAAS